MNEAAHGAVPPLVKGVLLLAQGMDPLVDDRNDRLPDRLERVVRVEKGRVVRGHRKGERPFRMAEGLPFPVGEPHDLLQLAGAADGMADLPVPVVPFPVRRPGKKLLPEAQRLLARRNGFQCMGFLLGGKGRSRFRSGNGNLLYCGPYPGNCDERPRFTWRFVFFDVFPGTGGSTSSIMAVSLAIFLTVLLRFALRRIDPGPRPPPDLKETPGGNYLFFSTTSQERTLIRKSPSSSSTTPVTLTVFPVLSKTSAPFSPSRTS